MSKMTIHRALSRLKTINEQINREIATMELLGMSQKNRPTQTVSGKTFTEEKLKENALASYNSISDLIKTKTALKRAIVESNSKVSVTIGSRTLTVADAITEKSFIELKKAFLNQMVLSYNRTTGKINTLNEGVERQKDQLLNASFSKETKPDEATIRNISGPYLEANTWTLIDPLSLLDKIKALDTEISTFESEVDAVLSESNAITLIEID